MEESNVEAKDTPIEEVTDEATSLEDVEVEPGVPPQTDLPTDVEITFEVDESSDTADSKNSDVVKEDASSIEIIKDSIEADDTNSTPEALNDTSDQGDSQNQTNDEVPMETDDNSENADIQSIDNDKEENGTDEVVKINSKDDSQETVSIENDSVEALSPISPKDIQEIEIIQDSSKESSNQSEDNDEKDIVSSDKESEDQENKKDEVLTELQSENQDDQNDDIPMEQESEKENNENDDVPMEQEPEKKNNENDKVSNDQATKDEANEKNSESGDSNKDTVDDTKSEGEEIVKDAVNDKKSQDEKNDVDVANDKKSQDKEKDTNDKDAEVKKNDKEVEVKENDKDVEVKENDKDEDKDVEVKENDKDEDKDAKVKENKKDGVVKEKDSKEKDIQKEDNSKDKKGPKGKEGSKKKGKEESQESKTNDSQSATKENNEGGTNNTAPTKPETNSTKKEARMCAECSNTKGLKYQILYQGRTRFLCSDVCFKVFREKQNINKSKTVEKCGNCSKPVKKGFLPPISNSSATCSEDCLKQFLKKKSETLPCQNCKSNANLNDKGLLWEAMEFCNDKCVSVVQVEIGRKCVSCSFPVPVASLGKYCVRFGMEIRQFCTGKCLDDFKKGLKVCSFCQQDISKKTDAMIAQVGDKGIFKDFCNNSCMEKYESIFCKSNSTTERTCTVCSTKMATKIKINYKNEDHFFCNSTCLASYCHSQKISKLHCEMCHVLYDQPKENNQTLICDNLLKSFCTKQCLNLFILTARKIVQCFWCKVKKYNFDMITHQVDQEQHHTFCSLNCYCQFSTKDNPLLPRKCFCDQCYEWAPATFHLTMSDNSIRNFCTYPCVLKFQSQFSSVTLTTTKRQVTPVGAPTNSAPIPVISNIKSLSNSVSTNAKGILKSANASSLNDPVINTPVTQNVIREVIVRPPLPKPVKNKMTQCKPISSTKGVSCKPLPCHKSTQTDGLASNDESVGGILPIPIPIFIPTPVHMFNRTVPTPMPFPIPLPVPVFIPTPHTSFQHINDQIKALQASFQDKSLTNAIAINGQEDDTMVETIDDKLEEPKSALKRKASEPVDSEDNMSKKFKDDGHTDYEDLKSFMATGLRWQYGFSVYNKWLEAKNKDLPAEEVLNTDAISVSQEDLCNYLSMFVQEIRRPNGLPYSPDILYYFCLGVQSYLTDNGREDNIFSDKTYHKFTSSLNEVLEKKSHTINLDKNSLFIVNEEILWSNKELGAHSPYILLNTILYFHSKYYHLKTIEEHQGLYFSHLTKKWKKGKNVKNTVCYLTYTPPNQDSISFDQPENSDNQMRCPIKFHEFYISKCPESAKSSKGPFYLYPIQDVKPDSPVWFSTDPLDPEAISKMLLRIKFVKELY